MDISLGDLASATAVVGTVFAAGRWGYRKLVPPPLFEVRRIVGDDDPDLDAALELYEGRFEDVPTEMEDVARIRAAVAHDRDDAEFLVIAKFERQVVAMLYGSFCEIDQLFFAWYVAGFRGDPRKGFGLATPDAELKFALGTAFQSVLRFLFTRGPLRDCRRAVAEISDHWYASKSSLFASWAERNAGRLYKIGLAYRQPVLTFPSDEPEQPMALVLADLPVRRGRWGLLQGLVPGNRPRVESPGYRDHLSREEAEQIVGCLYSHMYFEREPGEEWQAYMQAERARMFAMTGDGVSLESLNARRVRQ